MEATCSSETLVLTRATLRHISEDGILHAHMGQEVLLRDAPGRLCPWGEQPGTSPGWNLIGLQSASTRIEVPCGVRAQSAVMVTPILVFHLEHVSLGPGERTGYDDWLHAGWPGGRSSSLATPAAHPTRPRIQRSRGSFPQGKAVEA
jgi:hypothetical protein